MIWKNHGYSLIIVSESMELKCNKRN